ncbi:MAG: fucose isomerase [Spirochaetales bacterium]|uniref:Fucose isomerase n=1 Tax=Candidatus Thalassospirochaeta sargassi TaxID=3119039 RepID=A0AAJ1IEM6_9SPIO|nr:fucose isomerase [Spirochaetales bacterium]
MKHLVKLGVVCLARTTFDYKAAEKLYENITENLKKTENAEIIAIPGLVIEPEDAHAAALKLAGNDIDGLVIISGTFHLGHLALELEKILHKPILLWGLPELEYNGGKIRLNSVCGVNLNASNLYKSGVRNYHVNVGSSIDNDWVDALRIAAALRNAHIGLLGYRAKGFFNLGVYDLNVYSKMGLLIDHYELTEVWNREVPEEALSARLRQLKEIFETDELSNEQIIRVAELSVKLNSFMDDNKLSAAAIRCWPEFAAEFGISPCAAMSVLQSEGRIIACEGDIEGAISMLAHSAAGAETPYLFDFSQVDFSEDSALLWHCGVAPCNLWDGRCSRSLSTYFAGGKGVTADFVLKDGNISVVRFDSAGTEYRIFITTGKVIPMEKELKGTYMKTRFEKPVKDVLQTVVDNGIAHHASVVYGDFIRPFEIFAKIMKWKIIR